MAVKTVRIVASSATGEVMLYGIEPGGIKGTGIGVDPSISFNYGILASFSFRAISSISSVKENDVWPVPLFIEIKQATLDVDFLVVVLLLKAE